MKKLTHSKSLTHPILISTLLFSSGLAYADNHAQGYYGKVFGGITTMSKDTFQQENVFSNNDSVTNDFDNGFAAGAAFGYFYNQNLAVELSWDYLTNDNKSILSSGNTFT